MLYLYFWNMDECGYPLQTASSLIISVAFYCWTPGTDKRPEGVPAEAGNFRLSFSEVVHMAGSDSAYTIMNLFHNFDQAAYHCHYLILYTYIFFSGVWIFSTDMHRLPHLRGASQLAPGMDSRPEGAQAEAGIFPHFSLTRCVYKMSRARFFWRVLLLEVQRSAIHKPVKSIEIHGFEGHEKPKPSEAPLEEGLWLASFHATQWPAYKRGKWADFFECRACVC